MSHPTHWITQLLSRYERVVEATGVSVPSTQHSLNTLRLASAVLNKQALNTQHPDHAQQLVVIGPTQSGKSTLVNIVLDTTAAGISALAGFTVHAQGFASGLDESQLSQLESLMAPLARTRADTLSAAELDHYVLESTIAGHDALVSRTVVWDTPDFDSIDAGSYKQAVLKAVGLADVLVLMVSKDKYGDKSVWDMLKLVQPLAKPLLVCINKLDEQDKTTVENAFNERYSSLFNATLPPLVLLPFVRRTDTQSPVSLPESNLLELGSSLQHLQTTVDRDAGEQTADNFINVHRAQWFAPLLEEQQASEEWNALVRKLVDEGEQRYSHDYLNNPEKYDTFNRALAELLSLLEIPGLAPVLTRTRQMVTWPARKLLGLGRTALKHQRDRAAGTSHKQSDMDQEAQVLQHILDSTLVSLQSSLLEQPQTPYWNSMNQTFRENLPRLREQFTVKSTQARTDFQPQIDAAAQRLYAQLQSQPALLNTLRAARVTADAAGVALAVKTGGVAAADLLLAPAMLSVTTLMTESALGRYLDTIKAELKQQQGAHINAQVLQGVLAIELQDLSSKLGGNTLFAQQLEPELLDELAALKQSAPL